MNGVGLVGEFVFSMHVALLPRYCLKRQKASRKAIKISANRPKFDMTSSEALTPQHHRKTLSCGKQLKFSECLLPLITNILSYCAVFQSVKIKYPEL